MKLRKLYKKACRIPPKKKEGICTGIQKAWDEISRKMTEGDIYGR